MPRSKLVTITKDGQEAQVPPSAVKAFERHGWTAEDDGSSGTASANTGPEPAVENQEG